MQKILSILIAVVITFSTAFANNDANIFTGNEAHQLAANSNLVRIKDFTTVPNYVQFINGKELPLTKLESWLRQYYKTDDNYGLKLLDTYQDDLGYTHYRYQQTINGIPVKLAMFIALSLIHI